MSRLTFLLGFLISLSPFCFMVGMHLGQSNKAEWEQAAKICTNIAVEQDKQLKAFLFRGKK